MPQLCSQWAYVFDNIVCFPLSHRYPRENKMSIRNQQLKPLYLFCHPHTEEAVPSPPFQSQRGTAETGLGAYDDESKARFNTCELAIVQSSHICGVFLQKCSSISPGLLSYSTFLQLNQERKVHFFFKYCLCPQLLSLRHVNSLIQLLNLLSCPLGILSKVFVNGKQFIQQI